MPKPTCAVHVVFQIHPEHFDSFCTAVSQQAHNSLEREPWCHQFDVCLAPDRPHSVMLYETYDDRQAFVKHRETAHFAEFNARVTPWVASKEVAIWDIG